MQGEGEKEEGSGKAGQIRFAQGNSGHVTAGGRERTRPVTNRACVMPAGSGALRLAARFVCAWHGMVDWLACSYRSRAAAIGHPSVPTDAPAAQRRYQGICGISFLCQEGVVRGRGSVKGARRGWRYGHGSFWEPWCIRGTWNVVEVARYRPPAHSADLMRNHVSFGSH